VEGLGKGGVELGRGMNGGVGKPQDEGEGKKTGGLKDRGEASVASTGRCEGGGGVGRFS